MSHCCVDLIRLDACISVRLVYHYPRPWTIASSSWLPRKRRLERHRRFFANLLCRQRPSPIESASWLRRKQRLERHRRLFSNRYSWYARCICLLVTNDHTNRNKLHLTWIVIILCAWQPESSLLTVNHEYIIFLTCQLNCKKHHKCQVIPRPTSDR